MPLQRPVPELPTSRPRPLACDAPIEMLTARLQAVRSQTTMLEKLIDSEKFAGLGQLAGNVTQQLNNPLTVILGYASLLEETPGLQSHERRGIEAILSEEDYTITTTGTVRRRRRRAPVWVGLRTRGVRELEEPPVEVPAIFFIAAS